MFALMPALCDNSHGANAEIRLRRIARFFVNLFVLNIRIWALPIYEYLVRVTGLEPARRGH